MIISGGVLSDFVGGWAIIPFAEKPHYWVEVSNNFGVIRYKSICNMVEQLSGDANPPLAMGGHSPCKMCLRIRFGVTA